MFRRSVLERLKGILPGKKTRKEKLGELGAKKKSNSILEKRDGTISDVHQILSGQIHQDDKDFRVDREIEMSHLHIDEHKLHEMFSEKSNIVSDKLYDRRKSTRMEIHNILHDSDEIIRVKCIDIEDGKSRIDKLLDISLGGVQLLSTNITKEVGDKIDLKFKVGAHNFSLIGEITSKVKTDEKRKMKYGIKFINITKDESLLIRQIEGSIRLIKNTKRI